MWRDSAFPGESWQVTSSLSCPACGARRFVLPPAWAASLCPPPDLQCLFYVRVQDGYSFFLLCRPQGLSHISFSSGIHFFLSVLRRFTDYFLFCVAAAFPQRYLSARRKKTPYALKARF